jgi:hypothetical protein
MGKTLLLLKQISEAYSEYRVEFYKHRRTPAVEFDFTNQNDPVK